MPAGKPSTGTVRAKVTDPFSRLRMAIWPGLAVRETKMVQPSAAGMAEKGCPGSGTWLTASGIGWLQSAAAAPAQSIMPVKMPTAKAFRMPSPNLFGGAKAEKRRLSNGASPCRLQEEQKKWPLKRAAKFREETPRKGGGFAIKDRNTALQQYDGTRFRLQELRCNFLDKTPQKDSVNSRTLPCLNAVAEFYDSCAMQQSSFYGLTRIAEKHDEVSRLSDV